MMNWSMDDRHDADKDACRKQVQSRRSREKDGVEMASYYVNKRAQSNGDHEVHTDDCRYLPSQENQHYLGIYTHCKPAVAKAKTIYRQSNGCATCCPDCHTT